MMPPVIIHLDEVNIHKSKSKTQADGLDCSLPALIAKGFHDLQKDVAAEFGRLRGSSLCEKTAIPVDSKEKMRDLHENLEKSAEGLEFGCMDTMSSMMSIPGGHHRQSQMTVQSTKSMHSGVDHTTGCFISEKEHGEDRSDGGSHVEQHPIEVCTKVDGAVLQEEYACWEIWMRSPSRSHTSTHFETLPSSFTWKSDTDDFGPLYKEFKGMDRMLHPIILSPTLGFCVTWDIVFMAVIMWDCVTIPLQFLDPPEQEKWISDVSIACLVFWTLTIPRSLITGYIAFDGRVEMRPTKVFKRYVLTWFLFDVLIVSIDWADTASRGDDLLGSFRIMKSQRALKVLKVFRLTRLLKLPFMLNSLLPSMYSQKLRLCLNVLKISACVLLVAHIIACVWYAVGKGENPKEGNGWIARWKLMDVDFNTRYTYSLHFAITQFAGSTVVDPTTNNERWFAIVVLLFAYVSSAGFVSAITASLTRLSIISSRQATQFAELRRYLRRNDISAKLAYRVTQAAHYAVAQQHRHTPEQEVSLLSVITKPLRAEIHYEVRSPILTAHSFFLFHDRVNHVSMLKICHVACRDLPLAHHDLLFSEGERSANPQMYFIISGQVKYLKRVMDTPQKRESGWFCEASLWCQWIHLGGCRAGEHTSLLSLDVNKFHASITKYVGNISYGSQYAIAFVDHLNKQEKESLNDLDCGNFDSRDFMGRYKFQTAKTESGFSYKHTRDGKRRTSKHLAERVFVT